MAPQTDLAGAMPVASGPNIEDTARNLPMSAWTAAVPLTLVAPGGKNLVVIDKLGLRVEVHQIREGRVLVRCTGCDDPHAGAEGWMPRGVLWSELPAADPETAEAKDPLSLALSLRSAWASGAKTPDGTTPALLCAIIDKGWEIGENQARARLNEHEIVLQRRGATWALSSIAASNAAVEGDCG